jgi:hypothetical protein
MSHLPQFILFVLGAAMQGHLVHTAIFVPHITPVRTICPAAPEKSCFVVHHLWWYVFSGKVNAEGSFTC